VLFLPGTQFFSVFPLNLNICIFWPFNLACSN